MPYITPLYGVFSPKLGTCRNAWFSEWLALETSLLQQRVARLRAWEMYCSPPNENSSPITKTPNIVSFMGEIHCLACWGKLLGGCDCNICASVASSMKTPGKPVQIGLNCLHGSHGKNSLLAYWLVGNKGIQFPCTPYITKSLIAYYTPDTLLKHCVASFFASCTE